MTMASGKVYLIHIVLKTASLSVIILGGGCGVSKIIGMINVNIQTLGTESAHFNYSFSKHTSQTCVINYCLNFNKDLKGLTVNTEFFTFIHRKLISHSQ
jgi:hypothetical protein